MSCLYCYCAMLCPEYSGLLEPAECTDVEQYMGGGQKMQLWNDWAIQILVLLSFTRQVVLNFFAGTRRREAHPLMMLFLWLAYLLSDSAAIYALGHLSLSSSMSRTPATAARGILGSLSLGASGWPRHNNRLYMPSRTTSFGCVTC